MSNAYVPAWKRAGLKLKRSIEAQSADDTAGAAHAAKKAKLRGPLDSSDHLGLLGKSNGDLSHVKPQSLSRQDNAQEKAPSRRSEKTSLVEGGVAHSISPTVASKDSAPASSPAEADGGVEKKKKEKRKSVTFSPDAKAEDGPLTDLDYSEVNAGQSSVSQIRAKKKRKKDQAKAEEAYTVAEAPLANPTHASSKERPSKASAKLYLDYLEEYHNHRDRWRFNKNRQTQILQNIFNVYRIPPSHDAALAAYLSGLQGESRARLKADAERLLADASSDGTSASNNASDTAEQIQPEGETTRGADPATQKRAQIVLDALGDEVATPQKPAASTHASPEKTKASPNVGAKRSRGRKRRIRGNLADGLDLSSSSGDESADSSSSTSSSSSEDSDSEASSSSSSAD